MTAWASCRGWSKHCSDGPTTTTRGRGCWPRRRYPYLASPGLFADPSAATQAAEIARQYVDGILEDVRRRGCRVVEIDAEQVVFGVPATGRRLSEQEVAAAARACCQMAWN